MRIALREPPLFGRLRIKNKIRLISFIVIMITLFIAIMIITMSTPVGPKKSHNDIEYIPYKVSFGDTYWNIAQQLQAEGYKPNADIREVVHELIKISGIKAHELKAGDTIYIPVGRW